jgi:hypothetical protein
MDLHLRGWSIQPAKIVAAHARQRNKLCLRTSRECVPIDQTAGSTVDETCELQ